jgi:hypothetical protein
MLNVARFQPIAHTDWENRANHMKTIFGSGRKWRWPLGIALLGIAARLWLWWFSIGSNDVRIWNTHALHVLADGLARSYQKYQTFPQFNHPPLMAWYAAQARLWSGDNILQFARLIKLPGLAGEGLTMWALWRFAGPRAFAVYACQPAAILVSGFHGNSDCLYAALVLVSALAFEKENYWLSGLLWSVSLNVKLLPLALVPMVFLGPPNRKALARLAAGLALGMIPFLPAAWTAGRAMYHNIVAYNSLPDNWGLMALLSGGAAMEWCGSICGGVREWWLVYGRYAVVLSIVGVGILSRLRGRMTMPEQAAVGTALFLLLAPGFGVQYVVFAAPLICLVNSEAGAWWGWTSGAFLAAVYSIFIISWQPMESRLLMTFPSLIKALGLVAWAVLALFVWAQARRAWSRSDARTTRVSTDVLQIASH